MKPAALILQDNLNDLMQERGWTNNLQAVEASNKRLSNGTLGRIKQEGGENVRLNVLEDLAEVFNLQPHQLLMPKLGKGAQMNGWPLPPQLLAALQKADPKTLKRAHTALMSALDIDVVPVAQVSETAGDAA